MIDVSFRTAMVIHLYKTQGFDAANEFMEKSLKQAQDGEEIVG